ncbi:MAG: hypothetical protein M3Z14_06520 [Candidatus Eremiobacteraeota bacterium]|nr:hypothetical protein [Candidatus Eremiobacteraeota bacterium]
MTYVATLLGGRGWLFTIIATVLILTCATLWTTLLYLSRSIFAMGSDGVLPKALGSRDRRDEPFWRDRGSDRLTGVVATAIGLVALVAVLIATVALADRALQFYALGGTALGIPFAVWRGWVTRLGSFGRISAYGMENE